MSIQENAETVPIPSENAFDNSSTHWSVSTRSSIAEGGTCSLVDDESKDATKGCFPIVHLLLQSIFQWKKSLPPSPVDNTKLLADLKESVDLIVEFLEGSLTLKLKSYAEEIHFPKIYSTSNIGFCLKSGKYSLPTAQVWTATYLLNLCSQTQQFISYSNNDNSDENSNERTKKDYVNSNSFRRSLLSLCWEMEAAKKIAHEFNAQFVKFVNDINPALKKLQTILLSSSIGKILPFSQLQFNPSEFNVKRNLEILKRDKTPMVLEVSPTLNGNFPFSLSIDTKTTDGRILARNQICSKVPEEIQEDIITGLFKSAAESLENCQCLMESTAKRINYRGIIKKEINGSKDVTCCSALSSLKALVAELVSSRNSSKLNDLEKSQLHGYISILLEKWSEHVNCSQWVIMKVYELCDMVTLCYMFTLQDIKINIPELRKIQEEVNEKLKVEKSKNYRPVQNNLKHYAIGTLIEECNAKSDSVNSPSLLKSQQGDNHFYEQSMISTRYHLVIQECPLEYENSCGKYTIMLRPTPDLERVDSDMILLDRDCMIEISRSTEPDIQFSDILSLKTFTQEKVGEE